jgi:hypothetical protein
MKYRLVFQRTQKVAEILTEKNERNGKEKLKAL